MPILFYAKINRSHKKVGFLIFSSFWRRSLTLHWGELLLVIYQDNFSYDNSILTERKRKEEKQS